ncbi:hypothetical protein FI667_g16275, partial [Globisporangium splendens]
MVSPTPDRAHSASNAPYRQQTNTYHPHQPRFPIASLSHNSYNLTTASYPPTSSNSNSNRPLPALSSATSPAFRVPTVPWTEGEHRRFLSGLETYGSGQTANPQAAWQSITAAVRTRPIHEVKAHARRYFLELQMANARKRKEDVAAMQSQDSRWTLEEDARFEELLAHYSSASVCYPWEAIAVKLPGKMHRDVRDRYQKLCYDVARIEAGHHVSMSLSRSVSGNRGNQSYDDAGRSNQDAHCDDNEYTPVYDCVVTLTSVEEKLLMHALGQVHVSSKTSPEVLTAIASAMAAFTNSKDNKKPAQRTTPLFTLEAAQTALENVIQRQQTDVRVILETLVDNLKLQPRGQDSTPNCGRQSVSQQQQDHPKDGSAQPEPQDPKLTLATTGVALSPWIPVTESSRRINHTGHFAEPMSTTTNDASRRGAVAEDLLSFRAKTSSHQAQGYVTGAAVLNPTAPSMLDPSPRTSQDWQNMFSSPSPHAQYRPYTNQDPFSPAPQPTPSFPSSSMSYQYTPNNPPAQ